MFLAGGLCRPNAATGSCTYRRFPGRAWFGRYSITSSVDNAALVRGVSCGLLPDGVRSGNGRVMALF